MTAAALPPTRRTSAPGGPVTKGDRREQAILDALEGLLAERSIARVSVGQITARAGVGRTAFYFYFASREAALGALAERSVEPIYEAAHDWFYGDDATPRATLRKALTGVIDTWLAQTHLFVALIDASVHDEAMLNLWREQMEGLIAAAADRIRRDSRKGETWPGLDPDRTARALGWMTERYLYIHLPTGADSSAREETLAVITEVWERAIYRPE